MDDNKKCLVYHLKKWMVITLFGFYSCCMIGGIMFWTYMLISYDFTSEIMKFTMLSSFSGCLATCSMQYIKKLYKACIQDRIILLNEDGKEDTKFIGNYVYFLLRPFFACVFVLIGIFALKAGIIVIVSPVQPVENEKFLYICAVMAACIGFSVGKVLDGFETFAEKRIKKIMTEDRG